MKPIALLMATACLIAGCQHTQSGTNLASTRLAPALNATAGFNPQLAQMNDISVLYPLGKTQADLDAHLKASDSVAGGELLPAALYNTATGMTPGGGPVGIGGTPGMQQADLRVVAFRLDPCFAQIGPVTDPSQCTHQLRLIFQPLTLDQAGGSAIDGAVHAFYSLSDSEFTAALKAIIALRLAQGGTSDLGALAVHPIMVQQGMSGAMAAGLNAIVRQYSGASRLTRFTTFLGQNTDVQWPFSGFDIAGGSATPMIIPALPDNTTSVLFFAGFGAVMDGNFTPPTTATDNMQLLVSPGAAQDASAADRQSAFDAALRIENPNVHSTNTIDCASCHLAQPARDLIATPRFSLTAAGNANAFASSTTVSGINPQFLVASPSQRHDVHAFSYFFRDATINQRVINETVAMLAYINGPLAPSLLNTVP